VQVLTPTTREIAAMHDALDEARLAQLHEDVPVGAIILDSDGNELARAHNRREVDHDPLGHAELVAISKAARHNEHWRLDGTTMIVTLEPCAMCAGAIASSRISRLVIGARDPKAGATGSLYNIVEDARLPHRLEVVRDVLASESESLLKEFFLQRR